MKLKSLLLLFFGIISLTMSAQNYPNTYHVTTETLNLRDEPTSGSKVIKKLGQYDNLIIIKDSDVNWIFLIMLTPFPEADSCDVFRMTFRRMLTPLSNN